MATAKERLLEWLRDAHAMEEQAEQMLSSTSQRIENYPDLRAQMERHLEETRGQAKRLRGCIERLGSTTSTIKDLAGKVVAFGQGLSGLFVDDEVVKGSLASYTFEHMEIASYRILIAAAQQAGDSETARVCEQNLREEEAMAAWLEKNLASVTTRYLQREQTPGVTAKH
jgi:ferritin-like metal-binding protein YciE